MIHGLIAPLSIVLGLWQDILCGVLGCLSRNIDHLASLVAIVFLEPGKVYSCHKKLNTEMPFFFSLNHQCHFHGGHLIIKWIHCLPCQPHFDSSWSLDSTLFEKFSHSLSNLSETICFSWPMVE